MINIVRYEFVLQVGKLGENWDIFSAQLMWCGGAYGTVCSHITDLELAREASKRLLTKAKLELESTGKLYVLRDGVQTVLHSNETYVDILSCHPVYHYS
jgi:hypothetical protein